MASETPLYSFRRRDGVLYSFRRGRYKGVDHRNVEIRCTCCGVMFKGYHNRRFCSSECKIQAYLRRNPTRTKRREDRKTKRERGKRYRQKQIEKGLCKHCSRPLYKGQRCEYHSRKQSEADRIRKAKINYGDLWEHNIIIQDINLTVRRLSNGDQRYEQN